METKIVLCFLIRLELFGIHRADSCGESRRFLISSASAWSALEIDYIPGDFRLANERCDHPGVRSWTYAIVICHYRHDR